jgi:hypothetical protein
VAMGGRVIDAHGTVLDAGAVYVDEAQAHFVFADRSAADPGSYALALKPHSVDQPSLDAFFVRHHFLARCARSGRKLGTAGEIGMAVGAVAHEAGLRVGMSPLIDFVLQAGAVPARQALAPALAAPSPRGTERRRLSEMGFVAAASRHR